MVTARKNHQKINPANQRIQPKKVKMIGFLCDTVLLIMIFAVLFKLNNKSDSIAILAFSTPIYFYNMFHESILNLGYLYHLLDSLIALATIFVVSYIKPLTTLIIKLQTIALWCIYFNVIGFGLYELGVDPIYYNLSCLTLYLLALFMSVGKSNGVINATITWNWYRFSLDYSRSGT